MNSKFINIQVILVSVYFFFIIIFYSLSPHHHSRFGGNEDGGRHLRWLSWVCHQISLLSLSPSPLSPILLRSSPLSQSNLVGICCVWGCLVVVGLVVMISRWAIAIWWWWWIINGGVGCLMMVWVSAKFFFWFFEFFWILVLLGLGMWLAMLCFVFCVCDCSCALVAGSGGATHKGGGPPKIKKKKL